MGARARDGSDPGCGLCFAVFLRFDGALSLEVLPRHTLGAPGEPIERESASHRGLLDLWASAGAFRRAVHRPLPAPRACARDSRARAQGALGRARFAAERAPCPDRAWKHSLARGLEIRRKGLPLLSA